MLWYWQLFIYPFRPRMCWEKEWVDLHGRPVRWWKASKRCLTISRVWKSFRDTINLYRWHSVVFKK